MKIAAIAAPAVDLTVTPFKPGLLAFFETTTATFTP